LNVVSWGALVERQMTKIFAALPFQKAAKEPTETIKEKG
jgi:hypothetical protein